MSNLWVKVAENNNFPFTIHHTYTDYRDGQHDAQIWATIPEKWDPPKNLPEHLADPNKRLIGHLGYRLYEPDNSVNMNMIRVHPDFRRRGIATAIYNRLKEEHPEKEINTGYLTGEGEAFIKGVENK